MKWIYMLNFIQTDRSFELIMLSTKFFSYERSLSLNDIASDCFQFHSKDNKPCLFCRMNLHAKNQEKFPSHLANSCEQVPFRVLKIL